MTEEPDIPVLVGKCVRKLLAKGWTYDTIDDAVQFMYGEKFRAVLFEAMPDCIRYLEALTDD